MEEINFVFSKLRKMEFIFFLKIAYLLKAEKLRFKASEVLQRTLICVLVYAHKHVLQMCSIKL